MGDLYYEPTMYGIEDVTVADGSGSFGARIYYPSDDGSVFDVPIRAGTYPLVAFAHGQRTGGGRDTDSIFGAQPGCPADPSFDHQRWTAVFHLLARCGFVVVAPAMSDVIASSETSAARLEAAVVWMRRQWQHRIVLSRPSVFVDPDMVRARAEAPERARHIAAFGLRHLGLGVGTDASDILSRPTELGLVGHSWGARACARVAVRGQVRVRAVAAVAGSWDEDEAIDALIDAKDPTLLVAGTAEILNFSYLGRLWPALVAPKHQAALQGIGHWDWFGGRGGIQFCDPEAHRPSCPVGWHTAAEVLVGFMTKYLRNLWYLVPPHLLGYRGPTGSLFTRPNLLQYYEPPTVCGLKIRWDDPSADPDVGDITKGAWTEPAPWSTGSPRSGGWSGGGSDRRLPRVR